MTFEDPDLEGLENPESDEARYSWDKEFQRHVLAMILTDRQFLLQSLDLIQPYYFAESAHQKACRVAFEFFKKYNAHPNKTFVLQKLREDLKDDKSLPYYVGEITGLYEFFVPGLEAREFLLDRITYFAKLQAFKTAFNRSLTIANQDPESDETWGKVYDLVRQAMSVDRKFDIGLHYFTTAPERYERMRKQDQNQEKFITGFPKHDCNVKGGGYNRGEMVCVTGDSGGGKSLWLSNVAAVNVLRAKTCLYLSFELSQDRVAERIDAILAGKNVNLLYDHKEEVFRCLDQIAEEAAHSGAKDKSKLMVVKEFAGRTADVSTIRAYMAQLRFYGFEPDMVIFDYIGEIKGFSSMKTHESREQIVAELRGLSNEGKKFFSAIAVQPNRFSKEAQKAGRIEEEHLADSFGQIRVVDGCFSLNANEVERGLGLGRFWVIKERFGKAKYELYYTINPETLKMTEITKNGYKESMQRQQNLIAHEVDVDLTHQVDPYDSFEKKDGNPQPKKYTPQEGEA